MSIELRCIDCNDALIFACLSTICNDALIFVYLSTMWCNNNIFINDVTNHFRISRKNTSNTSSLLQLFSLSKWRPEASKLKTLSLCACINQWLTARVVKRKKPQSKSWIIFKYVIITLFTFFLSSKENAWWKKRNAEERHRRPSPISEFSNSKSNSTISMVVSLAYGNWRTRVDHTTKTHHSKWQQQRSDNGLIVYHKKKTYGSNLVHHTAMGLRFIGMTLLSVLLALRSNRAFQPQSNIARRSLTSAILKAKKGGECLIDRCCMHACVHLFDSARKRNNILTHFYFRLCFFVFLLYIRDTIYRRWWKEQRKESVRFHYFTATNSIWSTCQRHQARTRIASLLEGIWSLSKVVGNGIQIWCWTICPSWWSTIC